MSLKGGVISPALATIEVNLASVKVIKMTTEKKSLNTLKGCPWSSCRSEHDEFDENV